MNWVVDESVDRQIVERLREVGHVVWYVAEMAPAVSDDEVLGIANRESVSLLTADRDFGELVFRRHLVSHGVVLIRLSGMSVAAKATIMLSALAEHGPEIRENFTVISPGSVRIRKMMK